MHTFTVWAPDAERVEVRIGKSSYTMASDAYGCWQAAVKEAGPGTEYWFCVDGSDPMPDPRSPSQPSGVNGPSRLIDHSTFGWSDRHWQARPLSSAIIYELHVGTFTPKGTFKSTIERLDYLADLGITHVELMPVNEFSGKWGWGYDGVDLYAPHHAYGTPDDLKALVDACHARGLAVLLDVVYNHLGPAGNYLEKFGPYFTKAYNTPWGPAVNLDHDGSHEVRRFFADNALMWLREYHFDGLRLDAVHAFFDRSATHFLEFLAMEVGKLSSQLGRHLVLIAESDLNDPRLVSSHEAGGYGLDAQWSDDFHHALHSVLTGERKGYYEDFGEMHHLAKALKKTFVYDGTFSEHRNRVHGRPATGLSGHRFLAFAQNHDQVGNRAQGERLAGLVSEGRQRIAAALLLTSPFVPMLFQGEEFGASAPFQYFTQHEDAELGQQVSDGRRKEFQVFGWQPDEVPDPQEPDTIERSKISWNEMDEEPHSSLLRWHKDLISLRKRTASLSDGRTDEVEVDFNDQANWIVLRRGPIEIACNAGNQCQSVSVRSTGQPLLTSAKHIQVSDGYIELPPDSVVILDCHANASASQSKPGPTNRSESARQASSPG